MKSIKNFSIISSILIVLIVYTVEVKAQNPDARFVRIEFFGQPYYHGYNFIGAFPNDTLNTDSTIIDLSMHQTFWNYGAEYLVLDDETQWSKEGPFSYTDMWMWLTYPYQNSMSSEKVVNGFIHKIDNPDTLYPGWMIQASDNVDFYYRRKTTDGWIYLNPIADTLMADSTYLPPIFIKSVDTLDSDGDDYVFCFQLKMSYQVVDTIVDNIEVLNNDTPLRLKYNQNSISFKTPEDNYVIYIYDLTGKLILIDKFSGEDYNMHIESLNNGIFIYSFVGLKKTYTGKFIKQ